MGDVGEVVEETDARGVVHLKQEESSVSALINVSRISHRPAVLACMGSVTVYQPCAWAVSLYQPCAWVGCGYLPELQQFPLYLDTIHLTLRLQTAVMVTAMLQ